LIALSTYGQDLRSYLQNTDFLLRIERFFVCKTKKRSIRDISNSWWSSVRIYWVSRIIEKTGSACIQQFDIFQKYEPPNPALALKLIAAIPFLQPALDIPYSHHELWNGSGYPQGLQGEGIPQAARIFTVVDNWDALTSDRPYRKAWPREQAMAYLRENAGRLFDPQVVEVFATLLREGEPGLHS
jgi:HD-GYP domain-containing protein (c-di-GMP phosphodiesterase class II)